MIRLFGKHLFSSIKPLSVKAEAIPNGIKVTSNTAKITYEITNPLQMLLSTLPACQLSTLRAISKNSKITFKNIQFTKVQSNYELERFMKGGPNNHISDITLQAIIHSNGTQQDINALHEKVIKSCPVYQTLLAAGIKIKSQWKNVKID